LAATSVPDSSRTLVERPGKQMKVPEIPLSSRFGPEEP
jgi:hypothetical protein